MAPTLEAVLPRQRYDHRDKDSSMDNVAGCREGAGYRPLLEMRLGRGLKELLICVLFC